MNKLIRKDEAVDRQIFSRDLREYVVPVRCIKELQTFDEPEEITADYEDILRTLFNRCWTLTAFNQRIPLCIYCGIRSECDKRRSVGQSKEET